MSVTKFPDENRMQENVTLTKQYVQRKINERLFVGTAAQVQSAITAGTIVNNTFVVTTDE